MQLAHPAEKKLSRAQQLAKVLVEKWSAQDEKNAEKQLEKIKKRLLEQTPVIDK